MENFRQRYFFPGVAAVVGRKREKEKERREEIGHDLIHEGIVSFQWPPSAKRDSTARSNL